MADYPTYHQDESWGNAPRDELAPAYAAPDPAAVVALVRAAYSCLDGEALCGVGGNGVLAAGLALSEQVLCGAALPPEGTSDRLYLYRVSAWRLHQQHAAQATPARILGALVTLLDAALTETTAHPRDRDKYLAAIEAALRGHLW